MRRASTASTSRRWAELGTAAALAVAPGATFGAGGHHAVDDAALVDPGQCQIETWWDHELGGRRKLLHLGPACRAGAAELGLNLDNVRSDGATTTILGAQFKWATEVRPGLSAGVSVGMAVGDRPPRRLLDSVIVPLTWQAADAVLLHVNVGRDHTEGRGGTVHGGVALEWSPNSLWSFVGERFRETGKTAWRIGVRRELGSGASLDFSQARELHRDPRPWWTVGLTWAFAR